MAGVLTLIGWFGHVPQLTDWVNSGISMFANTAVAAGCAGVALILAGTSSRWTHSLSAGLGSVVLAIGGATLFQHILGVNLGIDELLIRHSWGIKAAVAPGRMGPPASTCFTVIGIALLLLRAGPRVQRAASVMGLLVGVISMLSLIGYLLGAQPLFSLAGWTGIAFQTASILFALGLALVASVPYGEPAWTFSQNTAAGVVARRSLPLIIGLCLALGWLRVQAQNIGLVDTAVGTAMLLLTQIILFSLLLWWCVRAVASRERKQKLTEDALRESERRATADLEATTRLYELGDQCANSKVAFEQCLKSILETGIAITRADKGNIQLLDAESETLKLAVQHGFDGPFLKFFASVGSDDAAACGGALQSSERIVIEDVARSGVFSGQRSLSVLLEAGVHAVQSTPLISSDGKILGIISTHFSTPHRPSQRELRFMDLLTRQAADFIERKQAEKRLAEQARLLDLSRATILVRNAQDRITYWNKGAEECYGYSQAEALGQARHKLLKTEFPEPLEHINEKLHRDNYWSGELIHIRKDGTKLTDISRWALDRDAQGRPASILETNNDITDRKSAEVERERLLQTEQELRATAEEANRLKDEFLAIMSHELRNPLNVILGYSELLVRSDEIVQSEQLHRMAEAIKRNAVAQSKLIRDLLDLSRLRSGKLVLNKETVSLMVVVNNAIDTVRGDAETKRLSIEVAASDEALFVEGDPLRLEQIVWNLLNNSVKFTPAGGKITVRLAKHDQHVMLSVEDTGQGIEPSFLPHAFEMFSQSYGVTTRVQSGLGIGLAVVQQLVELHGGSVGAHSEGPGKGSTFTIKLRLKSESRTQVAPTQDIAATLDQLAVLVVDDSQDTTEMLSRLLKFSGATVTAASSGEDALRLLACNSFDVVLSDISMPGMDGFEFLHKLRQVPGRADVPILALTGFGRPEDVERARAAGFYSHITKPFDFEALVAVLKGLPARRISARDDTRSY
jgi:PAS domain S-box-containing protein